MSKPANLMQIIHYFFSSQIHIRLFRISCDQ